MIGEALQQKEGLIEELEKELAVEKTRRMEMNKRFDEQVKEFLPGNEVQVYHDEIQFSQGAQKVEFVKA